MPRPIPMEYLPIRDKSCRTCAHEGTKCKDCLKCYNRDDYRGWKAKANIRWLQGEDSRGKFFRIPVLPEAN